MFNQIKKEYNEKIKKFLYDLYTENIAVTYFFAPLNKRMAYPAYH